MAFYDLGDWYKTAEESGLNPADFPNCPACGLAPKFWLFDNGRFVACGCFSKYEVHPRAESILSYVKRNKGSLEGYGVAGLKEAWRMWIDHQIIQSEMPEGQW